MAVDYGPCGDCPEGAVESTFVGLDECVCAPECEVTPDCPDAPVGVIAQPQCVLTFAPGPPTGCALVCEGDDQCPATATCVDLGGSSICMYPPA